MAKKLDFQPLLNPRWLPRDPELAVSAKRLSINGDYASLVGAVVKLYWQAVAEAARGDASHALMRLEQALIILTGYKHIEGDENAD